MLDMSDEGIRREAIDVVKDGLRRGVDDVTTHALMQWRRDGQGLLREDPEEHRLRWLE